LRGRGVPRLGFQDQKRHGIRPRCGCSWRVSRSSLKSPALGRPDSPAPVNRFWPHRIDAPSIPQPPRHSAKTQTTN
jgi:hypothetical protein